MKHSYLRNLAMQFMPGMTLGMLWQILADNRFRVDPGCLDRLALLHLSGIYNSVNARFERRDNKAAIQSTVIEHSPILILGSGAAARPISTICSGTPGLPLPDPVPDPFPAHVAYSQRQGARFINHLLPATQPMDNVPLAVHTPHEDEFALAALCGISPYLRFLFPETASGSRAALDPRNLSPRDLQRWKKTFLEDPLGLPGAHLRGTEPTRLRPFPATLRGLPVLRARLPGQHLRSGC